MPLQNNIKPIVDQPVWEWGRFAPLASTATSAWTTSEDGLDEYIYYMNGASFFRYSVKTDTWIQLQSYLYTPATTITLRYSKFGGQRGRIISAVNASTYKIPFFKQGTAMVGKTFRVTAGPGAGQDRTITAVGDELIEDFGVATAGTTVQISDSNKKWKINQWVGYTVRVSFGTNVTQQRTVIYNNDTTLYFQDSNLQLHEPFDNQGFLAAPTLAGAAAATHYVIVSQTITLNSPLSPALTDKSRFMIMTGGVWALTGQAAAPFAALAWYDLLTDTWIPKTVPNGLFTAALGTDFTLERTGEIAGSYASGTVSSATPRTIIDTTKSFTVDRYRNYQIRIVSGTGAGQRRRIQANQSTRIEINRKWDITPDATSQYQIFANTDNIWFAGNGLSAMFKYHVEMDNWLTGNMFDYGIMANITATVDGSQPFGVNSGVRNTGGVTAVAATPVAAGSGYRIGDVITLTTTGSNGRVTVENVSSTGQVLSVSLRRCGSGYATGTSATTGGTGTGCTINITTVGVVGFVTTAVANFLKIGDTVTIAGCTEAAWNGNFTILGLDQSTNTTFDIAITATANMVNTLTLSTTLITDPTATWDVNEHVGRLVGTFAAGPTGAVSWMRIASNTATALTLVTATGNVAVGNRYVIQDCAAFGRDSQYRQTNMQPFGYSTSGTTTTLTDSTKAWIPGVWVNNKVRIVAGTGLGNEMTITANDATTLTYSAPGFTPDTTTRYEIMDTFGVATGGSTTTLVDSTKNWIVNQWSGKRFRYLSSTGQMIEQTVLSNTANTLTFSAGTAPATTTNYVIYSVPVRGASIELIWTFGNGYDKYLVSPRGSGGNTFDIYDITTEKFDFGLMLSPQFETFTTGTMYAYDGGKYIYINKESVNRIYRLNLDTREIEASGTIPYGHSTAFIGNRMEIISTTDGLEYLYLMRHNAQEVFRTLIFW